MYTGCRIDGESAAGTMQLAELTQPRTTSTSNTHTYTVVVSFLETKPQAKNDDYFPQAAAFPQLFCN